VNERDRKSQRERVIERERERVCERESDKQRMRLRDRESDKETERGIQSTSYCPHPVFLSSFSAVVTFRQSLHLLLHRWYAEAAAAAVFTLAFPTLVLERD
jgi:hypothetical protein